MSAQIRETEPKFELSDIADARAEDWTGGTWQGPEFRDWGIIRETARENKNRRNKARML